MIKSPGGWLAVFSALWVPACAYVAYDFFAHQKPALGVLYVVVAAAAIGLWLRWRPAKWILIGFFILAMLGSLLYFWHGQGDWHRILKTFMAAYFAYLVWQWQPDTELD